MLNVGFVGLGDLGGAMARRIIEAGFPASLWARREASLAPFAGSLYRRAESLAELGRRSDIACICVFGSDDVRQVLLGGAGILSGMAPGSVVLIHSTVDVPTCREVAAAAAARGISVLDAPVTGGRPEAMDGTLAVMVGGDEAAVDRALPVLQSVANVVRRVGPLGSGQILKMLNNVTSFCNGRIATLAIETGCKLGLDGDAVMAILRVGGARSRILDSIIDHLLPDPAFAAHARTMVAKDTQLFREMCRDAGLPSSLLDQLATEWSGHLVPEIETKRS